MSGRNSYLSPKTSPWIKEQYAIRGIDTVIYRSENLSSKNTRGRDETGAKRSNTRRNSKSQKMVSAAFTGNSAAVKRSGKSETCPATAKGLKAPRYRRSLSAKRLNGMITNSIAFSWTCQPKRNDA